MNITKELLINTALAAFWVFAGIVVASNQPFSKATLFAGLAAAARFVVGALSLNVPKVPAVPVDE